MTYLWIDETLPEEDIMKNKQKKESTSSDPSENTGYFTMLRNWLVVVTVSLYGRFTECVSRIALEGVIQGTYDTVLPIWLASDESVGGFELNKKDLGWVLSFVSPMQMATCKVYFTSIISSAYSSCDYQIMWNPSFVHFIEYDSSFHSWFKSCGFDFKYNSI